MRYLSFPVLMIAVLSSFIAVASAPRLSPPIYVLEVTVPDRAALQSFVDGGYNVSNVQGLKVTVYVDESGLAEINSLGYAVKQIEVQPGTPPAFKDGAYTSYASLGPLLSGYAISYPDLIRVSTLGLSVQNREIWAAKITWQPDIPADKPAVKYIATIHGDEVVGTEMCLYFIKDLLEGYGTDPYITDLLQRTIVWVVPLMNPDGHVAGTRYNANSVDLNRSFPTYAEDFESTLYDGEPLGDVGMQPEIVRIMRWHSQVHAALSANFHGGTLVVNYPYDYEPGIPSGVAAPSPDEDVFSHIALEYAANNPPMYASPYFPFGITNGSLWYSITGGMMDWHYRFLGCPEVTLEISYSKRPNPATLSQYWEENRDSMYAYLESAHIGIRGLVRDRNSDEPLWAKVLVSDREQPVFTNPDFGNYHRLLLPGSYNISLQAPNHITYYADNLTVSEGPATRLDVSLSNGDINNDGIKDGADTQAIVDAALGRPVDFDPDVDGRGLTATDIQAVINAALP